MSDLRRVALFALAAVFVPVHAAPSKSSARIQLYLHSTDARLNAPVAEVSLKDGYFAVFVEAPDAPRGVHELGVTIYNSQGREVLTSSRRQKYIDTYPGITSGYYFSREDLPGTWWVTTTLDGQPLTELEFKVNGTPQAQ